MTWGKLGKALLFPPRFLMLLLLPLATASLVGAMVFLSADHPIAITAYVLSAYTLTVWCIRTPTLVKAIKAFKNENKFTKKWLNDARFRINVSLFSSILWNAAYALLHLGLGIYHHAFWFYSLSAYYVCLCAMRLFLMRHTKKYAPGEQIHRELIAYRACGWVFLVMNLALALIIFFMVYWGRTFTHHMITTIAMAAYTFTALTVAIMSIIKYKRYNSPVFSATKITGLAAALVSLLTLESTMLTTFGGTGMTKATQQWMLAVTGSTISAFILATAIYIIRTGTKRLKALKTKD